MIKPTKGDTVLSPIYGGKIVIAKNFVLSKDTQILIDNFNSGKWTFVASIDKAPSFANQIITAIMTKFKHYKSITTHDTATGVIIFIEKRIKNKTKNKILNLIKKI